MTPQHRVEDALEQQFAGCQIPGHAPTVNRVLLPSNGFQFTWDFDRRRAAPERLPDRGRRDGHRSKRGVINPSSTYRVTVNSFLATGGDGFTVFNVAQIAWAAPGYRCPDRLLRRLQATEPSLRSECGALGKPRIIRVDMNRLSLIFPWEDTLTKMGPSWTAFRHRILP